MNERNEKSNLRISLISANMQFSRYCKKDSFSTFKEDMRKNFQF